MSKYVPVKKNEVKPCMRKAEELLRGVHDYIWEHYKFTFSENFIGSTSYNLAIKKEDGDGGFDIDVNLIINFKGEIKSAKGVRSDFKEAIDQSAKNVPGFKVSEEKNRVIRIDYKDSKLKFTLDIALYSYQISKLGNYQVAVRTGTDYNWEDLEHDYKHQQSDEKYCKDNKLWNKVRDVYLSKQNNNPQNKESRALYAESLKEVREKNQSSKSKK